MRLADRHGKAVRPMSTSRATWQQPKEFHLYFITRFSILDCNTKMFHLTRENKTDQVSSLLFDDDRLNRKFIYFEQHTLPSILAQTDKRWSWHIFYGATLPQQYVDRLLSLCSVDRRIECLPVHNFAQFFSMTGEMLEKSSTPYATARLDDDDALSAEFVGAVSQYAGSPFEMLSFANGRSCTYDPKHRQIVVKGRWHEPYNAFGLVAFNRNVYTCGNHTKVAKKYKCHVDSRANMYIVACDKHCDTHRRSN